MATAQEMVNLYIEAEKALLQGKQVQMFGRTITMEDLDSIRAGRQEWEGRLEAEGSTTPRKSFQILFG